jgi:crossover junction endodeoxyribonuclease RuvC
MSTYLGLDPSLTGTGICLIDDSGRTRTYRLETVRTDKLRGPGRLLTIRRALEEFLIERPALVAVESYAYGAVGRVFQLGELGGVLRVAIFEAGIPYVEVAPVQLKKYATGQPGAEKSAVIAAAESALGATVADDNQADAFFLASIASSLSVDDKSLTLAQRQVILRLRSPGTKKKPRKVRRDRTAI